jgi:hypothetical protein
VHLVGFIIKEIFYDVRSQECKIPWKISDQVDFFIWRLFFKCIRHALQSDRVLCACGGTQKEGAVAYFQVMSELVWQNSEIPLRTPIRIINLRSEIQTWDFPNQVQSLTDTLTCLNNKVKLVNLISSFFVPKPWFKFNFLRMMNGLESGCYKIISIMNFFGR